LKNKSWQQKNIHKIFDSHLGVGGKTKQHGLKRIFSTLLVDTGIGT
jgi:hypothetical protein